MTYRIPTREMVEMRRWNAAFMEQNIVEIAKLCAVIHKLQGDNVRLLVALAENTQVTPAKKAYLSNAAPKGGTWEGE